MMKNSVLNGKNRKLKQEFYFKDQTRQEVADMIAEEMPIKMIHMSELVERVHRRYPIISKAETALIIKTILTVMREFLILGKIWNFANVFSSVQLYFSIYHNPQNNQQRSAGLTIRVSSPKELKYIK